MMVLSLETLWSVDVCLVILGWVLFTLIVALRPKPRRSSVSKRDLRSWYGVGLEVIGIVILAAGLRSIGTPFLGGGVIEAVLFTALAGLVMTGSLFLTRAAVFALGRQWSVGAEVVEGHELVTGGAYGLVRHPIYTAMLGMFFGSALAVSSWWALLAGSALFLAGTVLRVRSEEGLLSAQFGQAYRDYARRVPALLPRLRRG